MGSNSIKNYSGNKAICQVLFYEIVGIWSSPVGAGSPGPHVPDGTTQRKCKMQRAKCKMIVYRKSRFAILRYYNLFSLMYSPLSKRVKYLNVRGNGLPRAEAPAMTKTRRICVGRGDRTPPTFRCSIRGVRRHGVMPPYGEALVFA